MSRFPAAVGQFTVPNDASGILTVIHIALFGSEAVRATGSLLLSFAGGHTASPVGPSRGDAAWAAVQQGITAAFALEALQAAVEGVEAGASGFEPISYSQPLPLQLSRGLLASLWDPT